MSEEGVEVRMAKDCVQDRHQAGAQRPLEDNLGWQGWNSPGLSLGRNKGCFWKFCL